MHPSEVLLPKPCDGITFWGEISSYRGLMDFYRFFLKFFRIFLPTGFWGFFFQILDVCGEMLAEKNWAFQSSRLKKKSRKLQKSPGGTKPSPGLQHGMQPAQSEGELPSPDRIQEQHRAVCEEICPVAARKNGLEADPSLGNTDSIGGTIFAVKL